MVQGNKPPSFQGICTSRFCGAVVSCREKGRGVWGVTVLAVCGVSACVSVCVCVCLQVCVALYVGSRVRI